MIEAAVARDARQLRLQQGIAYSLAQLVVYATHDPKKMPAFDKVFPDRKPKPLQTAEEFAAAVHGWMEAMHKLTGE